MDKIPEIVECFYCPTCGRKLTFSKENFYRSFSPFHRGIKTKRILKNNEPEFLVPFCKKCIVENLDINNINSIKNSLMMCDKPYLQNAWGSNYQKYKNKSAPSIFGFYIKNLALNYKDLRFKDSEFNADQEIKDGDLESLFNYTATREDIIFWGKGHSGEDYYTLNENYFNWTQECKSDTISERKMFKQICLKELEIDKGRELLQNVDKQVEALQKLMDGAGVKPKDVNAANDPSNVAVLGMRIKDIETKRPAEIFDNPNLYKDYYSIGEYFNRMVLRPLKNLLLGTREFDKEFNLDETGDSDE